MNSKKPRWVASPCMVCFWAALFVCLFVLFCGGDTLYVSSVPLISSYTVTFMCFRLRWLELLLAFLGKLFLLPPLSPTGYVSTCKINTAKLGIHSHSHACTAFHWHFILPGSDHSRVYWNCPFLQVFLAPSDNQTDKPDLRGTQSRRERLIPLEQAGPDEWTQTRWRGRREVEERLNFWLNHH